MKKTLLIFTLLLCAIAFKGFGQKIMLKNLTSYSYNVSLQAHDGTYTGCNGLMGTTYFLTPGGGGPYPTFHVADFNDMSCLGSGPGWGAGCASNTGSGWDGIALASTSCVPNIIYSLCSLPPSLPILVTDGCTSSTISFNWVDDGHGNITVTIQ